MIYCAKCGGQNADEAQFCSKCGAPLHGPQRLNGSTGGMTVIEETIRAFGGSTNNMLEVIIPRMDNQIDTEISCCTDLE